MNGQFRPQTKLSNPSGQGHLLLIILNLVLLAGVSVFIYLNSTSIDEIKDKQESSSSNINDLKKKYSDLNTKHLSLVEQDTYLQSVLQIFDTDLQSTKSSLSQVKVDQQVNKGLIDAINVNLSFVDKLRTDFTKSDGTMFDTEKLGDLMTNLKALSDELVIDETAGTRNSLIDYIKSAFKTPEFSYETELTVVSSEFKKYQRLKDVFIVQMKEVIIQNNLPILDYSAIETVIDSAEPTNIETNKTDIQTMYTKYMNMFISVNIYQKLCQNIISEISKLEENIDAIISSKGYDATHEKYIQLNTIKESLGTIKDDTTGVHTSFNTILRNTSSGNALDIIDITTSADLNTRIDELNMTSVIECKLLLDHLHTTLDARIQKLRPHI